MHIESCNAYPVLINSKPSDQSQRNTTKYSYTEVCSKFNVREYERCLRNMSQPLQKHLLAPKGTGPGVWRSKSSVVN